MCVRRVLLLVALVSVSACAKVSVLHVTKPLKEEGVFYALPKTVAKVQVKIEKTEKTTAPYMRFAPIFAPGATALCDEPEKCRAMQDTTTYALAQGATFTTSGEPDPAHVYLVKISGGGTLDQTMSMAWTDSGLATSASASITNRTIDVAVAGVKMASSLGSKAALGASGVASAKSTDTCPGETREKDPLLHDINQWVIQELENVDTEESDEAALLIANYCDMKPELRKQYDKAKDQELLSHAVASYKLRVLPFAAGRHTFLTQPTNSLDPGALVDRLDKIIDAALKSLFLGTSEKTPWEPTFEVRSINLDLMPQPNEKPEEHEKRVEASRVELLRIDGANGPCPIAPLSVDSKPMPANFAVKELSCDAPKKPLSPVKVQVVLHPPSGQLFDVVSTNVATPTEDKDRSFRYRIPAQVLATVRYENKEYGSGTFSVAQLGRVVSLPARRASKTLSYDLAFVEQTGGLRSFKIGSTGMIDAATLAGISEAGGTYLDARNTKRDKDDAEAKAAAAAAATAADELTVVTRQHTLLKLKHEICEIQKKYGLACTVEP